MSFDVTYPVRLAVIFFSLFFATCHFLQGQQVQYKQWQVEDGLPQNSVNHLVQTKDGYIW